MRAPTSSLNCAADLSDVEKLDLLLAVICAGRFSRRNTRRGIMAPETGGVIINMS